MTGELRDGAGSDAVVRSFERADDRACARPSCTASASATLTFRYGTREAWIERLADRAHPQAYDLCAPHAARTRPPEGWQLRDRRPEDERRPAVPHPTPVDLGGDRTVAVLAAALRSVPDPVSEDAIAGHAEVDRTVEPPDAPDPLEPLEVLALAAERDHEAGVARPVEDLKEYAALSEPAGLSEPVALSEPAGLSEPAALSGGGTAESLTLPDLLVDAPVPRPPLAVRDRAEEPGVVDERGVAADW